MIKRLEEADVVSQNTWGLHDFFDTTGFSKKDVMQTPVTSLREQLYDFSVKAFQAFDSGSIVDSEEAILRVGCQARITHDKIVQDFLDSFNLNQSEYAEEVSAFSDEYSGHFRYIIGSEAAMAVQPIKFEQIPAMFGSIREAHLRKVQTSRLFGFDSTSRSSEMLNHPENPNTFVKGFQDCVCTIIRGFSENILNKTSEYCLKKHSASYYQGDNAHKKIHELETHISDFHDASEIMARLPVLGLESFTADRRKLILFGQVLSLKRAGI